MGYLARSAVYTYSNKTRREHCVSSRVSLSRPFPQNIIIDEAAKASMQTRSSLALALYSCNVCNAPFPDLHSGFEATSSVPNILFDPVEMVEAVPR